MITPTTAQYKFVLVGDSAVGKSTLLCHFVDGKFDEKLLSTIGVDFKFRRVTVDNEEVKLQIWDTAGQETFRSIVSAYYNSADAIIICYDISSFESFQSLQTYWLPQAENNNKKQAKIFVVGNKIDLPKKQVEGFSLEALKQNHRIQKFYEVSAKNNTNVESTFIDITKIVHKSLKNTNGGEENKTSKDKIKIGPLKTSVPNQVSPSVGGKKKPCCQ